MKRVLFLGFALGMISYLNAQQIVIDQAVYQVKGKTILKAGEDVTQKLSETEKETIFKALDEKLEAEKKAKKE
ncbi:MAG TPA: hypothetical protein PLZ00_01130, partial [Mangrovimonas sp.]|nr:hypothetical protein [Mangrovimonas sp.]